ncbi:hypothetical protein ABEW34_14265 [Paenibacillus algorifonticola]|uniref:hypothetical protein n=1 Tax=Paenibacillus algorifonticola TaxID=684063 RepID=UPI003D2D8C1E
MDRFVSLKVGQGDSFYLQRDKYSILVDGGLAENGLAKFFMGEREKIIGKKRLMY